jgi:hypothetical protein
MIAFQIRADVDTAKKELKKLDHIVKTYIEVARPDMLCGMRDNPHRVEEPEDLSSDDDDEDDDEALDLYSDPRLPPMPTPAPTAGPTAPIVVTTAPTGGDVGQINDDSEGGGDAEREVGNGGAEGEKDSSKKDDNQ